MCCWGEPVTDSLLKAPLPKALLYCHDFNFLCTSWLERTVVFRTGLLLLTPLLGIKKPKPLASNSAEFYSFKKNKKQWRNVSRSCLSWLPVFVTELLLLIWYPYKCIHICMYKRNVSPVEFICDEVRTTYAVLFKRLFLDDFTQHVRLTCTCWVPVEPVTGGIVHFGTVGGFVRHVLLRRRIGARLCFLKLDVIVCCCDI